MTSIELINDEILPLETTTGIATALGQMDELKLSNLPVILDKKFLGTLSEDDLLLANDEELPISELSDYFKRLSVNQHTHYFNAIQLLTEHKLSLVPVVDENNMYLGAITEGDLLQANADLLSVGNPGGIIILHVNENDFSLSEIARLVEANDAKILSAGIHSVPGSPLLQVTLKINKINIEPVIQTFNRFDYNINTYFGENEKDEELLRNRYESLMHYLNM